VVQAGPHEARVEASRPCVARVEARAEVGVRGGRAVQGEVGSGVAHRLRGEAVEEMCSGVQSICLVARRERRLKRKQHIMLVVVRLMRSARPFGGGLGTQETQLDAMGEEGARGGVVELVAIITLEGTDRATKLGEGGERVELQPKWESPNKMREVVQNDQVLFVTRGAEDRRTLEIFFSRKRRRTAL
jgi:hypothetical protein